MSTATSGAPVLGPRPFHVTDGDHRGITLTISVLFAIYACMVFSMRIATKYRSMGLDDYIMVAAVALAVLQYIIVIVASADGFGASYSLISHDDVDTIARLLVAGDVFLLLALFMAKCSVIWLCRRLFAIGQHQQHRLCEAMGALSALWCFAGLLSVNVGCTSTEMIRAGGGKCSGLVTRWTVIGVLDAITEVMILALSVAVIFPLRMAWPKKLQAIFCFALRLPIIVFIGLSLKFLPVFDSASDPGVALARPILFRQAQLLYSLLSASIPSLNQYLRKFDTTQTSVFGYTPGQYGSSNGTYAMGSMAAGRSQNRDGRTGTSKGDENGGRPDHASFTTPSHRQYQATVEGPHAISHDVVSNASRDDGSIGRQNSEDHIIRKDVRYEVRAEE